MKPLSVEYIGNHGILFSEQVKPGTWSSRDRIRSHKSIGYNSQLMQDILGSGPNIFVMLERTQADSYARPRHLDLIRCQSRLAGDQVGNRAARYHANEKG